ncbi:MAG: lysophospholipid acyltransferase family protein [Deltaproteobacteria bacterium]|nr:lysophospholipid acyltransferase family protein [Deltaproteobacteria bacterium]
MAIYNSKNLFFIKLFTKFVPRWLFPPLAFITAVMVYCITGRQRRGARSNLRVVTGRRWVEPLIISSYYKFARNWCDIMLMTGLSGAGLRALVGRCSDSKPMDEALAIGTGAILVSPHLGNWELGGLGLADLGYPVNVLTFREPDERFNIERERLRKERGIRFIYVNRYDTSPLAIIEAVNALRRNEVLAILGDRDGSSHTILIDFFGRPTNIPVGAAYLAMASGAPVIPVFVVLEQGRYSTIMEEPIYFVGGHGEHGSAIRSGMEKLIRVFEQYIRAYPDQWYNYYEFWDDQEYQDN